MRNAINSIGFTIQTKALNPTLIPRNENEIQAIKKNDKKKKIYQRDTKFKAKSFIKAKKNGTKKVKNTKKLSKSKKSSKSQKFRE